MATFLTFFFLFYFNSGVWDVLLGLHSTVAVELPRFKALKVHDLFKGWLDFGKDELKLLLFAITCLILPPEDWTKNRWIDFIAWFGLTEIFCILLTGIKVAFKPKPKPNPNLNPNLTLNPILTLTSFLFLLELQTLYSELHLKLNFNSYFYFLFLLLFSRPFFISKYETLHVPKQQKGSTLTPKPIL